MLRNLIKLGVLGVVATCSWQTASHYINEIVLEIESRQPTITDVIMKQQVQESLKEAEKEIEKVAQEENIIIKQEEVAIKPATPPKEETKEVVKEEVEVATEEESLEETDPGEVAVPEGEQNQTGDELLAAAALTKEETLYLANYLIDNYFLFGERYYTVETDPVRYERKKLANDMEAYIIDSIGELQALTNNLFNLKASDIKPILEDTTAISEQFKVDYAHVGEKGQEFQVIYDESNKYFEAYIRGLGHAVTTFETIETTTNKALVLPLMMKSINQDILPAIRDVLNQGFAVKEKTNKIYIEGVDGSFLLTPDEVMAIIENPRSILPPKEQSDQVESTTEQEQPEVEAEEEPKEEASGQVNG